MDGHQFQNPYGEQPAGQNPYVAGQSMTNGLNTGNPQESNPYAPPGWQKAPDTNTYTYTETWMNSGFPAANHTPYQQPYYPMGGQQPAYGYQPYTSPQNVFYGQPEPKGVGFAVTGLILGILSIVACIFMVFDWILAIPGLIFSSLALAKKNPASQGLALGGLICNIVGFVLSALLFFIIMQS